MERASISSRQAMTRSCGLVLLSVLSNSGWSYFVPEILFLEYCLAASFLQVSTTSSQRYDGYLENSQQSITNSSIGE